VNEPPPPPPGGVVEPLKPEDITGSPRKNAQEACREGKLIDALFDLVQARSSLSATRHRRIGIASICLPDSTRNDSK